MTHTRARSACTGPTARLRPTDGTTSRFPPYSPAAAASVLASWDRVRCSVPRSRWPPSSRADRTSRSARPETTALLPRARARTLPTSDGNEPSTCRHAVRNSERTRPPHKAACPARDRAPHTETCRTPPECYDSSRPAPPRYKTTAVSSANPPPPAPAAPALPPPPRHLHAPAARPARHHTPPPSPRPRNTAACPFTRLSHTERKRRIV